MIVRCILCLSMMLEATMYYLMEHLARERQYTMLKEAEAGRLAHRVRQERRAHRRVARLKAAAVRASAGATALGASVVSVGVPGRGRSE